MAGFGDPAGLRRLANALQGTTTLLSTTASSLGGQVNTVVPGRWSGGAATAFQTHWGTEYTQVLDLGLAASTIGTVLDDLATALEAAAAHAGTVTNPGPAQVAMQQGLQLAQQARNAATNRLAGVKVPAIQAAGMTPNLSQSMAWANANVTVPPPAAPAFGQGYQLQWDLGSVSGMAPGFQTPEQVMAWFEQHPQQVFPFTLGPSGTTIVSGEQLNLQTPPGATSPVEVTTVTPTSFTFTTLPGHFDPPGSTITFSVVEQNGHMFLEQTAHWNFTAPVTQAPLSLLSVPFAASTWANQAANLRNVVDPQFDANGNPDYSDWPVIP